ncbi:hypothetical protein SASPL_105726 [Salvia splendens]|uniref:ENTH domain-containing protein n=1 Tax=Salvia splendens TaxID=180675 RepID=A0A8X8YLL1_SALSN|nr:hypothetical protein SASPL_105726 [Salvia splendens]
MESFRKAYGALKDSTKVGLASLNSDFKVLDVAIVKATNHVECPPKERHVVKILAAISANRPRADVGYCIHALCRRLSKTRNWIMQSKTRFLNGEQLLEHLPSLQQLLYRLICCQPEGLACHNYLVQYALALFFDMPKHDAVRALDIYRRAGKQAAHLADFYGFCRTLDLARTFHFPTLKQPPPTFLATMEEYIKEAPQMSSLTDNRLDPLASIVMQDLSEVNEDALKIEENNALALAIFEPDVNPPSSSNALAEIGSTSGWELAIVEAPSNMTKPQLAQPQMAGGFDNLLLDSLYEDSAARRTMELHSAGYNTSYRYNPGMQVTPFDHQQQHFDPFAMSNNIPPPTNVQMAMLQQQHMTTTMMMPTTEVHQGTGMEPYNPYTQQAGGYFNPFSDPFHFPQPAAPPHEENNRSNNNNNNNTLI